MESFPPEAPIATREPRWKRVLVVMVAWISDSKTVVKQVLQRRSWVLGRRICARTVLQCAQSFERGGLEAVMALGGGGCCRGLWVVLVVGVEGHVLEGGGWRQGNRFG